MAKLRLNKAKLLSAVSPFVQRSRPRRMDLSPELWGASTSASGELTVCGHSVPALARQYGSPVHVVNAPKLLDNMRRFQVCKDAGVAPCRVYYSYKTNPVPGVLRLMHNNGVGAEVISPYELWLALELGVAPKDIVYNGPGKTDGSMEIAIDNQIGLINCNHRAEIPWVVDIARKRGKKPRIGLRIATGLGWGGQFGTPFDEAVDAFREALSHPELEVIAIHSHLGSPIRTLEKIHLYIDRLLSLCDQLWSELRFTPAILDIGGSLAIPTVKSFPEVDRRLNRTFLADLIPPDASETISIDGYVRAVHTRVREHFARVQRPAPTIYMEPGRAMTGNTQHLALQVMTLKKDRGADATFAIMNGGINLADACRSEYHQLFHAGKMRAPATEHYRLAGPICTPGDVIYWSWKLPHLEVNDCITIMDSGAYLVPFSTSFSYPQPAIVMVDNNGVQVLRRHETFADIHARDKNAASEKTGVA